MSDNLKRSELIFIYDVTDANPNGDPADENKPRIDEETGYNIVTDVRLKRTIRDYLYDMKGYNGENGKDIFVREIIYDEKEKYIQYGKLRGEDYLGEEKKNLSLSDMIKNIEENVIKVCIDVRLFGCVIPVEKDDKKKSSVTLTGPVQFQMGRSLHRVSPKYLKGTGAFAANKELRQKTFREEYVLPYSCIVFHGIINQITAKETQLSENDVNLLLEAMWEGTKSLISRSKFGHIPRLLIKVDYKDNYYIGELHKYIKIESEKEDEAIRSINDFTFDLGGLQSVLKDNKDKIDKIHYKIDNTLQLDIKSILNNGLTIKEIIFENR